MIQVCSSTEGDGFGHWMIGIKSGQSETFTSSSSNSYIHFPT